ncbi:major facilitator superfamily domain-containing protein [Apiospora hydei]|uniref:Major facilitator superfamily domain-containing protein n=1 Tax=Apiospora hydei TaxID=1337664 RepID=A0ABR1UXK2_9PEZI
MDDTKLKPSADHVEEFDAVKDSDVLRGEVEVMGTVKLTHGKTIYIPTPTADPQDPLNMSLWQKYVVLIVISIFSCLGLSLISGFGGLLGFYIPDYSAAGKGYADITHLMTYPTLFMGIGNLFGMPLAYAVGRRSVLLVSTVIMILAAGVAAGAKNFEWHLAARMVLGLAAGQSEALVPMITQEVFFLHERSRGLMIQQTIQVILTAIWTVFAGPIAGAITPQWWYGLGAILAGVQFLLAVFFVPETKYYRPMSSFQESTSTDNNNKDNAAATPSSDDHGSSVMGAANTMCTERPPLDYVNFAPRTWRSDMRLWVGDIEWRKGWEAFYQTFELVLYPNVFWALCINGLTLGVNVAIGTTPPYNFPQTSASYVNTGQIATALLALPLFGHGSDGLIRWFSRRRGGMHEPETRLVPLIFPMIVGVFTAVLYGQGAAHPERYHWFVYVWGVAAYYFCFVGANIVAITYLLDSYPTRAGPLLIIICAFRGIISFGVSYGITPFIETAGWDGAFGAFGAMTAFFGLLGIPIYVWGKQIRQFTGRFAKDKSD